VVHPKKQGGVVRGKRSQGQRGDTRMQNASSCCCNFGTKRIRFQDNVKKKPQRVYIFLPARKKNHLEWGKGKGEHVSQGGGRKP